MKRKLMLTALVTALLLTFTGCGKSKDDSKASEKDITSEIFADLSSKAEVLSSAEETTTTTTTTVTETEVPEETEEPEEDTDTETETEVTEPEEPQPKEHSGGETIFNGLDYSFKTYDDTWLNYNDKIQEIKENIADEAAENGIDVNGQDDLMSLYDAIYTYAPDQNENYISNFDIMINQYEDNNIRLEEVRDELAAQYNSMNGVTLLSTDYTYFGSKDAMKFLMTIENGDMTLKRECFVFKHNKCLFQVSMTSTVERYDSVEQDFNEVISTFTFS